jgi:hypothetical protein
VLVGLEPGSGYVGFVAEETAMEQVFSMYFSFPCQEFHGLPHAHHYLSSSWAGNLEASVINSGLDTTPLEEEKCPIIRCQRNRLSVHSTVVKSQNNDMYPIL